MTKETVISSSTHRTDDRKDPVLEGIWNYLQEKLDTSEKQDIISSAYEMCKFITEFCIEFFHSATFLEDMNESIHQIFENSINMRVRPPSYHPEKKLRVINGIQAKDEAELFNKFTKKIREKIKETSNKAQKGNTRPSTKNTGHGEEEVSGSEELEEEQPVQSSKVTGGKDAMKNLQSIQGASALLKEVKDIRDELNIIKSVVDHQNRVWSELCGIPIDSNELKGPSYILKEIKGMDGQASRIQDAVCISAAGL